MTDFATTWSGYFPDQKPLGFMLRCNGAQHWVRFHSLPDSKRYAETEAERQLLLDRQNALATEVLGDKSLCWLAQSWSKSWEHVDEWEETSGYLSLPFAYDFEASYDGDDLGIWCVHAGCEVWSTGRFDGLLLAIADEFGPKTLWLSVETGAVFAPYDGGVDLYVREASEVERLKKSHPDWLSPYPSGL